MCLIQLGFGSVSWGCPRHRQTGHTPKSAGADEAQAVPSSVSYTETYEAYACFCRSDHRMHWFVVVWVFDTSVKFTSCLLGWGEPPHSKAEPSWGEPAGPPVSLDNGTSAWGKPTGSHGGWGDNSPDTYGRGNPPLGPAPCKPGQNTTTYDTCQKSDQSRCLNPDHSGYILRYLFVCPLLKFDAVVSQGQGKAGALTVHAVTLTPGGRQTTLHLVC